MKKSNVSFLYEESNQKSLYKLAPHMYTESIPEDDWVGDILGSEDDAISSYSDAY